MHENMLLTNVDATLTQLFLTFFLRQGRQLKLPRLNDLCFKVGSGQAVKVLIICHIEQLT